MLPLDVVVVYADAGRFQRALTAPLGASRHDITPSIDMTAPIANARLCGRVSASWSSDGCVC
jgi:hypothetical protein